ncbi:MAG: class I SAM-dependent RNA methyltransferase [Ginsengibacter sp.]
MHSFNKQSRITITCSKRLSIYLQQEIIQLGYKAVNVFATGVQINGTLNDCVRLNLNLRTASQVLYSLNSFSCANPDDLYQIVSQIQWETIIDKNGYFSITSTVNNPSINNSLFVNVRIKDAIVDRFREKFDMRPDSGSSLDKTVIHLYWKDNDAEIFLDTTGETLSKHGYRRIPGKAPMLESLAAAAVLATNWDAKTPFINPMCGSGTVAIEAAMIATNRRPGLFRENYGFSHILGFNEENFQKAKQQLADEVKVVPGLIVEASDISEDAINITRINAGAAGVGDLINYKVCDFADTEIPQGGNGVIFFNPEYGERLGDEIELEETYSRIGDFMKKDCKGYAGFVFTGNFNLAKKVGLKAKRKIEFYNGKIDCRLLQYELYSGTKNKQ